MHQTHFMDASAPPSATCPHCRETFTPQRPWQKFDRPACRRAYHKAGGESGLVQKVAELEERVRRLEGVVYP